MWFSEGSLSCEPLQFRTSQQGDRRHVRGGSDAVGGILLHHDVAARKPRVRCSHLSDSYAVAGYAHGGNGRIGDGPAGGGRQPARRRSVGQVGDLGRASVWAAFDAWGMGSSIRLNINDPKDRSHSVTAASMDAPHATELRRWTEKKCGVTLGIGLGMAKPSDPAYHGFFRVAHMGHVNAHMTLGMLAVIDAGMKALNIPHSEGAIEAASRVVSEA